MTTPYAELACEREAQMLANLTPDEHGVTPAEQRELRAAHEARVEALWAAHAEADAVEALQNAVRNALRETAPAGLALLADGVLPGCNATSRGAVGVRALLTVRPACRGWLRDMARRVMQLREVAP